MHNSVSSDFIKVVKIFVIFNTFDQVFDSKEWFTRKEGIRFLDQIL